MGSKENVTKATASCAAQPPNFAADCGSELSRAPRSDRLNLHRDAIRLFSFCSRQQARPKPLASEIANSRHHAHQTFFSSLPTLLSFIVDKPEEARKDQRGQSLFKSALTRPTSGSE